MFVQTNMAGREAVGLYLYPERLQRFFSIFIRMFILYSSFYPTPFSLSLFLYIYLPFYMSNFSQSLSLQRLRVSHTYTIYPYHLTYYYLTLAISNYDRSVYFYNIRVAFIATTETISNYDRLWAPLTPKAYSYNHISKLWSYCAALCRIGQAGSEGPCVCRICAVTAGSGLFIVVKIGAKLIDHCLNF